MIPVFCRVKTDAEAGTYGDCVRACVASILETDAEAVPHVYHDGCDGEEGRRRLVEFLAPLGFAPFFVAYDGSLSIGQLGELMCLNNPGIHYMLMGETSEGEPHAVVCCDSETVHNPSWSGAPIVKAINGIWLIMVIVRK